MKIFKNRGDIYISKSKGIKSAEERVLLIILAIIVILTIAFVVMLSQKYSSVAEFFVGEDVSVSDLAVDDMESLPQISGKSNYLTFADVGSYSEINTNSDYFNVINCKLHATKGIDFDSAGGLFTDDFDIPLVLFTDSKLFVGSRDEDSASVTETIIRGKTVRLQSYDSGAVYLGASGSTAVTSDILECL